MSFTKLQLSVGCLNTHVVWLQLSLDYLNKIVFMLRVLYFCNNVVGFYLLCGNENIFSYCRIPYVFLYYSSQLSETFKS